MATLYQKSLTDLRRVESALKNELAGVDLAALKALSGAVPMSAEASEQWRDILSVLAIPLVDVGRSVETADAYVHQQFTSNRTMCRILSALQAIIIVVVFIAIVNSFVQDLIAKDIVWTSVKTGTLISVVIFVLTVCGVWRQALTEEIRRLEFDMTSPVSRYLHRFQLRLSMQRPVTLMQVVVSGSSPGKFIEAVSPSVRSGSGSVAACKQAFLDSKGREVADLCSLTTNGGLTVDGVAGLFKTYPRQMWQDMAGALLELRTNGVDAMDHASMWRCVDGGLNDVRALVLRSMDAVQGVDDAERMVRTEIAPLLKVDAAMLRNAFNRPPNAPPLPGWRRVTAIDGRPMDRAECFAMGRAAPACHMAYFAPATLGKNGACYLSTGTPAENRALEATARLVGPDAGRDSLMVKSVDRGAIKGKVTYATAAQTNGKGVADLIRTTASSIAGSIVQVLRRTQFRVDLTTPRYRDILDSELLRFYGAEAFDATVRDAIEDVYAQVAAQVKEMSAPAMREADLTFVTPQRLVDKVAGMSETELLRVQRMLARLALCTRNHALMYPVYTSEVAEKVVDRLTMSTNVVVFVGFCIVLMVLYTKGTKGTPSPTPNMPTGGPTPAVMPLGDIVRFVAYAVCGMAIALITMDTLLQKSLVRTMHNMREMSRNGDTLVASTDRLSAQFEVLMRAVGRGADGASGAAVDPSRVRSVAATGLALAENNSQRALVAAGGFIGEARTAMEKYAMCNSIVNGQPKMPMPIAEALLYALVGAGFVFISAYVIHVIAPSQRVHSLRLLYDLKARVGRGDPAAVLGAQALLPCTLPDPEMWQILTWFWVATVVLVTLWFVMVSMNVVKDYTRTLEVTAGCDGE
jgi:hypothetical protein